MGCSGERGHRGPDPSACEPGSGSGLWTPDEAVGGLWWTMGLWTLGSQRQWQSPGSPDDCETFLGETARRAREWAGWVVVEGGR